MVSRTIYNKLVVLNQELHQLKQIRHHLSQVTKNLSKIERERRLNGIHPLEIKSDLLNYLKSTEDALNEDDAQIIAECIIKQYVINPHIEIEAKEWSGKGGRMAFN